MQGQLLLQKILRERLSELQRANPRFSLRSFANRVGIHPGTLSSILNGKRLVSREIAERTAKKLSLDPQESFELLREFPENRATATARLKGTALANSKTRTDYLKISAAQFRIISDWEHNAILSLLGTDSVFSDARHVARRLGISETRAEQALARLLELKFIRRDSRRAFRRATAPLRTTDGISDASIRKAHSESLDLAKTSLEENTVDQRDIASLTLPIDVARFAEAQSLIRKLQDDLLELFDSGHKTEVYRLTTAFFPLTKLESERKK